MPKSPLFGIEVPCAPTAIVAVRTKSPSMRHLFIVFLLSMTFRWLNASIPAYCSSPRCIYPPEIPRGRELGPHPEYPVPCGGFLQVRLSDTQAEQDSGQRYGTQTDLRRLEGEADIEKDRAGIHKLLMVCETVEASPPVADPTPPRLPGPYRRSFPSGESSAGRSRALSFRSNPWLLHLPRPQAAPPQRPQRSAGP